MTPCRCPDDHLPPWHQRRWTPPPEDPTRRQQVSADAYLDEATRRTVLDAAELQLAAEEAFEEVPGAPHVRIGTDHVLHTRFRLHEHPETWQVFERQAAQAGVATPRVVQAGRVQLERDACIWWVAQQRAPGRRAEQVHGPLAATQAGELGRILARLHRRAEPAEPSLAHHPVRQLGYRWLDQHDLELADLVHGLLADIAARDLPQVAVHGDCYRHNNVLFEGPAVAAVLDPHLIRCGPAEFDLAKALAGERDRGGFPDQLLAGYRQAGGPDLDHPTLELAAALHSAQTQVAHSPDPARPAVARQQVEHLRAAVTRWS